MDGASVGSVLLITSILFSKPASSGWFAVTAVCSGLTVFVLDAVSSAVVAVTPAAGAVVAAESFCDSFVPVRFCGCTVCACCTSAYSTCSTGVFCMFCA